MFSMNQSALEIGESLAKYSLKNWREPFDFAKNKLQLLNPSQFVVQTVRAPGIYFFATIEDHNLHLDLNFNAGTGEFLEAVANIFLKKTQQLCVFGNIQDVFLEIENYFSTIHNHSNS